MGYSPSMSLSDEELERYARHIVLRQVGGTGQARLKAAKVLVVGAGGLGSPVILYLAAAVRETGSDKWDCVCRQPVFHARGLRSANHRRCRPRR